MNIVGQKLSCSWRDGETIEFHVLCVSRGKTEFKHNQTAALEIQPDIRSSLRQNGTGGGRVFAGWIWRGLALLASP